MKTVRIWSYLRSLVSRPIAEVMPGYGGTITSGMPSDSATSAACIGPAPPKATSANSRGSWPFWTVRERIAPAMFAFAIVTMPSAASSSGRPSSSASALHGRDGRVAVELHLAAEEALGVDAAEHDVRVGQRRLLPPWP